MYQLNIPSDYTTSRALETFVREATIAWVSLFTLYLPCIVIIIIKISGQILAREWTKYECGVFSELGYKDDRLYPALFRAGNLSRPTAGRVPMFTFQSNFSEKQNCLVLPPSGPESCTTMIPMFPRWFFQNRPCLVCWNFPESSAASSYKTLCILQPRHQHRYCSSNWDI